MMRTVGGIIALLAIPVVILSGSHTVEPSKPRAIVAVVLPVIPAGCDLHAMAAAAEQAGREDRPLADCE